MKVLFFSVFILLGLSSCKKETFTPCDGFEELYGEWESIDSDVDGYLKLGFKDYFEYRSTLDRDIKKRMTSCFKINVPVQIFGEQWDGYNILLNENKKDNSSEFIFFSQGKDTIVYRAAAYDTDSLINYTQVFVRKN